MELNESRVGPRDSPLPPPPARPYSSPDCEIIRFTQYMRFLILGLTSSGHFQISASQVSFSPRSFSRSFSPTWDRNDPKSGLVSPNHTANLSGLVLGCIEADV